MSEQTLNKTVYLVGMMGAGKSAVSRMLASRLEVACIDLDQMIVKRAGMSINDIFAQQGEAHFRKIEKEVLHDVSVGDVGIVATGGGVVLDDDNIAIMKHAGVMIYLKAAVDTLFDRVKDDGTRPLLKVAYPQRRLQEILDTRARQYEKADYVLETDDRTLQNVVDTIVCDMLQCTDERS